jgi:purine-nucleoside phosphorylase
MFPNIKNKHSYDAFFEPTDYLNYLKKNNNLPKFKVPKAVMICYDNDLFDLLIKKKRIVYTGYHNLYYTKESKDIGIVGRFGVGAPSSVLVLEELIALGIKNFVSFGTCGTLQKNINIGDFILCDKAIRDEGVSHHYLKSSKYAYSSKKQFLKAKKVLDKLDLTYHIGASWTIDTPYRETVEELKRYQKENVLCVEMEASALYAVAEYRKVDLICIFTISDSLAELIWSPHFHKMDEYLLKLYELSIEILKK